MASALSDDDLEELDGFLGRVRGGAVPNCEALDGFFAALACCPDLVPPSEFLPVLQEGETEDGDLVFDSLPEAEQFMGLVMRHWNDLNGRLAAGEVYVPLMLLDGEGRAKGNDWARGFVAGTRLRWDGWSALMEDEARAGPLVAVFALAHENDPDPALRPFRQPLDDDRRADLIATAAAGVMRLREIFRSGASRPFGAGKRADRKTGRNDPCPCGSGRKFERCCGRGPTLH